MRCILPAWLHTESPEGRCLSFGKQHFLYFLPLPQGQGSFLCGFMSVSPLTALPRKKDLIRLAGLASDRRSKTSRTPAMFFIFRQNPVVTCKFLSLDACRV